MSGVRPIDIAELVIVSATLLILIVSRIVQWYLKR